MYTISFEPRIFASILEPDKLKQTTQFVQSSNEQSNSKIRVLKWGHKTTENGNEINKQHLRT